MIGEYALKVACTEALNFLHKASQYAKEDVEYCKNYLKAAQSAVIGLEKECDQILVQSRNIDLNLPEEVTELRIRIDEYLFVDYLRPILNIAVKGLEKCHKALQESADRFWQWPWVKEERQIAISDFTMLLDDLKKYLDDLDKDHLIHRKAGTGVLVWELNEIKNYLNDNRPRQLVQKELIDFINEIQNHRDKKKLLEDTSRIESTINDLIRAFRS